MKKMKEDFLVKGWSRYRQKCSQRNNENIKY